MVFVYILLALVSPGLLAILGWILIEWRKAGGGGKETARVRQDVEALRREFAQVKADHTDVLLGLNAVVARLESRLDGLTGIEQAAPGPARPEPPQRQL